ncbi:PAAR domain-containing protein [Azohydromonas aeria]|uniref:PAAR domain-containing protein n=1 Tax=Azohydromonas aeria TaxID=2590212 RepID=UPI0012FC6D78|nr:PAAR domain-containing protein [Azohydromonas aeria]
MPRNVIRVGDATDHGGRVLASGAPHFTVDGISVALQGDPCSCPKRGHAGCTIAEGDASHTIDGVPVAYEGHRTSCGARLIASTGRFSRDG